MSEDCECQNCTFISGVVQRAESPDTKYICATCDEELQEGSDIFDLFDASSHLLKFPTHKVNPYTPEVEQ